MSAVPPPYQPRDNTVSAAGPSANPTVSPTSSSVQHAAHNLEFAETTSVSLEWRLTGLKAMYDTSKGELKSKCIKSAVFGDADNLWEVLWYPNSGAQGGDFASLYLSCVPTQQERDQAPNNKWTRKGLWWFRFEIKSTIPDERTSKIATLATKDAADHTFAVKTANWGWQQFAKRDSLFLHPTVVLSDSFTIVCVIQAQPQPPAGYWLGVGLQPKQEAVSANILGAGGRAVGSGGGLSAWSGGEGASAGVAGGTTAAGGVKKVVPRDLINSVGALLDDPLYSDIEFILPQASSSRPHGVSSDGERPAPRKIYANKKLLARCDYFSFMFDGSFKEADGFIADVESDDEVDTLSDSDMEDEGSSAPDSASLRLTTTTSRSSSLRHQSGHTAHSTGDLAPPGSATHAHAGDVGSANAGAGGESDHEGEFHDASPSGPAGEGAIAADVGAEEETRTGEVTSKVPQTPGRHTSSGGPVGGPKKTRVIVRDAAWSTWWAILYWLYTDTIYFAPLTSSFEHSASTPSHLRASSLDAPKTRQQWIHSWLLEHSISPFPSSSLDPEPSNSDPVGPRPVSAKAVYRLADKLDLPALKLRAFQHIIAGLTAQNIPAEVFSRFSTTFEDVRKVQIAFFLKHWGEIKKSETMTQIWTQIRLGKHVGFEEVWPLIVSQLDFKPS